MTSTTALGHLSQFLRYDVETLRDLVELHHYDLADGTADSYLDSLPPGAGDELRAHVAENFSVDLEAVLRDVELLLRTRLRQLGVDLVHDELVVTSPQLPASDLAPVVAKAIGTIELNTLFSLHTRQTS